MSKRIFIPLILLFFVSCRQQGHVVSVDPVYSEVVSKLEDAINYEIESKDLNAISIVLVEDQEIIWNNSFGFKDEAKTTPADNQTIFRVGSVSKLFTDIALMQKVEEGTIDLDAPITTYIPELTPENPYTKPITLRMLTSHRSGMLREPRIG